jgi:hypothetical protein
VTLSFSEQANYLNELGIQVWYPRVHLTNAIPPKTLVTQASNAIESLGVKEEAQSIKSNLIKDITPESENRSPIEPFSKTKPPEQSESHTETPIRFALHLYVIGDCLVASSLSPDYLSRQESATRLLNAIVKVTFQREAVLHHDHLISWPFFASPNANQGIESAQKYVNGVIEHLIEAHRIEKILAFGGVLAKLNGWRSLDGQLLSVPYLLLPSLYKMLQDPLLKKKAWQTIQQSDFLQQ